MFAKNKKLAANSIHERRKLFTNLVLEPTVVARDVEVVLDPTVVDRDVDVVLDPTVVDKDVDVVLAALFLYTAMMLMPPQYSVASPPHVVPVHWLRVRAVAVGSMEFPA